MKMKEILRKDNCLAVIEKKLVDITYRKWKEMNDNVIPNLHLALTNVVLSNITEKTITKDI